MIKLQRKDHLIVDPKHQGQYTNYYLSQGENTHLWPIKGLLSTSLNEWLVLWDREGKFQLLLYFESNNTYSFMKDESLIRIQSTGKHVPHHLYRTLLGRSCLRFSRYFPLKTNAPCSIHSITNPSKCYCLLLGSEISNSDLERMRRKLAQCDGWICSFYLLANDWRSKGYFEYTYLKFLTQASLWNRHLTVCLNPKDYF